MPKAGRRRRSAGRRAVRVVFDHPQPGPELEVQFVAFGVFLHQPAWSVGARHGVHGDVLVVDAAAFAPARPSPARTWSRPRPTDARAISKAANTLLNAMPVTMPLPEGELVVPLPFSGQTFAIVTGRVYDETDKTAVAGHLVALLDPEGGRMFKREVLTAPDGETAGGAA